MKRMKWTGLILLLLSCTLLFCGCTPLEKLVSIISTTPSELSEAELDAIYQKFVEADQFYFDWMVNTKYVSQEDSDKLFDELRCRVAVIHDTITTADLLKQEIYKYFSTYLGDQMIEYLQPEDVDGQLYIIGSQGMPVEGWYYQIIGHEFSHISDEKCILHVHAQFPAETLAYGDDLPTYTYPVTCIREGDDWVFQNDLHQEYFGYLIDLY